MSYRIVINGNRLMTLADGHKTIVNLGSNAMMNEMQKLIGACMAGNLQALQSDFDLTYETDAQHYYITAQPHDKNIAAAPRPRRGNACRAHDPRFSIQ